MGWLKAILECFVPCMKEQSRTNVPKKKTKKFRNEELLRLIAQLEQQWKHQEAQRRAIERKRKKFHPEGAHRQHINVSSVTFHCAMWGVFWNTTSSEMWRCKIR
jgi:hypothetical protein